MVRYYGFLSPVKRRLLEEVVYVITETVKKRRCKSGGEGCIRGYRLAELVPMHERLARQQVCG